MCGIFGYIGQENAVPFLLTGLQRLEYRGYDSAGLAVITPEGLVVQKVKGRVQALADKAAALTGKMGIAHTRWATHGAPSAKNAHPHMDTQRQIMVVHNGIIENHAPLRAYLQERGHIFVSETDSEVVAHLIAEEAGHHDDFALAVRHALARLEGAFGIVVFHKDHPGVLIAARRGSPLVIGLLDDARLVASDASALVEHTREVLYLEEDELAVLTPTSHMLFAIDSGLERERVCDHIEWDADRLEKAGYETFMQKEIHEQRQALSDVLAGRFSMLLEKGSLPSLHLSKSACCSMRRIIIVACGTSWHAGLVAKHYFEQLAGVIVEVAYASEFRYSHPLLGKEDLVIAISQSGETADTQSAVRLAKSRGAATIGIVNVVGSTIAREVNGGLYLHAGPEIGVASTKAFTTQLVALLFTALHIGLQRGVIAQDVVVALKREATDLLPLVDEALSSYEQIRSFAPAFKNVGNALYLGRGVHFPVALEGALKLKEISYIHAEGLPAAEMKHGPIALIDERMPVIVLAPQDDLYAKVLANIQEIKARGARVLIIATAHDPQLEALADEILYIPQTHRLLQPILSVIPLQLLAYEIAVLRGCDVDKPRNLAKSVTVE